MNTRTKRSKYSLLLLVLFAGAVISGYFVWVNVRSHQSISQEPLHGDFTETVKEHELPSFVLTAEKEVQEAYRYAAGNEDILRYIPCYCGCVNLGHRHNLDCYIAERPSSGYITFTVHAAY